MTWGHVYFDMVILSNLYHKMISLQMILLYCTPKSWRYNGWCKPISFQWPKLSLFLFPWNPRMPDSLRSNCGTLCNLPAFPNSFPPPPSPPPPAPPLSPPAALPWVLKDRHLGLFFKVLPVLSHLSSCVQDVPSFHNLPFLLYFFITSRCALSVLSL